MNKTLILEKIKKHIQDYNDADNPYDAEDALREAYTLGEKYDIDYPKMYKIKKLFCGLFGSFNAKLEIIVPTSFYMRSRLRSSNYWFEYHGNNELVIINCIPSNDRDKQYHHPFIIQLTNECNNVEEKLTKIWETPFSERTPEYYKMKCNDLLLVAKLINYAFLSCDACESTLTTK